MTPTTTSTAWIWADEAVERVRRVLAMGAYQMNPGELPYQEQVRAVIDALKEQG